MKKQRYYQSEATEAARDAFRRKLRGILVVMATGMGKTVLFVNWAKMTIAKGGRVLILVDRDVLCDNAADELSEFGMFPVIERGRDRASPLATLVVASIQSISLPDRLAKWNQDHWALVIVDEAHRSGASTYRTVLDRFKQAHNIGVTATPNRPDGKGLWDGYEEIVSEFPLKTRTHKDGTIKIGAVEDGWLCNPDFHELPVPITLDEKIATKRTITDAEQEGIFDTDSYLEKVFDAAAREVRGFKSLYFWNSRRTSSDAAKYFQSAGIEAMHIDGSMSKKQIAEIIGNKKEKITGWFNEKRGRVLCNCQLLCYGYNQPDIELVGLGRVYKSLTDYLQAIGRGTRVLAGVDSCETREERLSAIMNSEKPMLRVIDMAIQNENHNLATPAHLITDDPKELDMLKKSKQGRSLTFDEMQELVKSHRASDGERSRKALAEALANAAMKAQAKKFGPYLGHILKKEVKPGWKPTSPGQIKELQRLGFNGVAPSGWHAHQIIDILRKHRQKEEYALR